MHPKNKCVYVRVAKERYLPVPSSLSDRAKKKESEGTFRLIQSHFFEDGSLSFTAQFIHAIKGKMKVDVSFDNLRMDEPVACAKYIREYIAEDRRGLRPLNKWADTVLKHIDKHAHIGKQRTDIRFGTMVSAKSVGGHQFWHVRYDDGDEEDLDSEQLKQSLDLFEQFKDLDSSWNDGNSRKTAEANERTEEAKRGPSRLDSNEDKTGTENVDNETMLSESHKMTRQSTGSKRVRAQKAQAFTTRPESSDMTRINTRSKKTRTENVETKSSRRESNKGIRTIITDKKAASDNTDAETIRRQSRMRTRTATSGEKHTNGNVQTATRRHESPRSATCNVPFSVRAQVGTKSWEWDDARKNSPNVIVSKRRKYHRSMTFRRIQDHCWKDGRWYFTSQYFDPSQNTFEQYEMSFLKLREEEPIACAKYIHEYISENRRGERPLNTWAKSILEKPKPNDIFASKETPSSENLKDKYVSRRVAKKFRDGILELGIFFGTVESAFNEEGKDCRLWHIIYDDGDEEDMHLEELKYALDFYEQCKKLDHRQKLTNTDYRKNARVLSRGNAKSHRLKSKVSHRESLKRTPNTIVNSLKIANPQPHAKISRLLAESSCRTSRDRTLKTGVNSLKENGMKIRSTFIDRPMEVEGFRNRRINGDTGKEEYLIKWMGFPESRNTWEALCDKNVQRDASKWWKQETIRRNYAVLMSSDDDSDDEVLARKDPAKWRKKLANYKLVSRESPKTSSEECGERDKMQQIVNGKTPSHNAVYEKMHKSTKNPGSNAAKRHQEGSRETGSTLVTKNYDDDQEVDKTQRIKNQGSSKQLNEKAELSWSNTRRICPEPCEETRRTNWSSLAIQKCLKCPRIARKDCIGLLCIRCCTDKTCVAHEEQRAKARWKEDVTSGTTEIQQAAKAKRALKLIRGRFRESEFQYINDTVVLWDLRTVLQPKPPQSLAIGATTDDQKQSNAGRPSQLSTSGWGKTAISVATTSANISSASSTSLTAEPVSTTTIAEYKNDLKIKEDILRRCRKNSSYFARKPVNARRDYSRTKKRFRRVMEDLYQRSFISSDEH